MARKKIAAGNWKMNTTRSQGTRLARAIAKKIPVDAKCQVILAPPTTHLESVAAILKGNRKLKLAAQDCSAHASGAYTGEVSADMLKSVGANYVIVGHSERRMHHDEDNKLLTQKVERALEAKLRVIFCFGEPLSVRRANKQKRFVARQIRESLFHLSTAAFKKVVLAYEPIWAIGTGMTATPEQAQQMHRYIRQLLAKKYGTRLARDTSILYGGSVKPNNAHTLFEQPDVDGGLVGGASLDAAGFLQIVDGFEG